MGETVGLPDDKVRKGVPWVQARRRAIVRAGERRRRLGHVQHLNGRRVRVRRGVAPHDEPHRNRTAGDLGSSALDNGIQSVFQPVLGVSGAHAHHEHSVLVRDALGVAHPRIIGRTVKRQLQTAECGLPQLVCIHEVFAP